MNQEELEIQSNDLHQVMSRHRSKKPELRGLYRSLKVECYNFVVVFNPTKNKGFEE